METCAAPLGFHLYKRGRLSVVGFDGRRLNDPRQATACRDQLLHLVEHHDCQVLVVDLTEVDIVSSWILGILAAIKRCGVDVQLYHPSPEIRGVLSVTHLDELLTVRHEALPSHADVAAETRPAEQIS